MTIPPGVKSICHGAFWGCKGLTTITIPASVTFVATFAFHSCDWLTTVTMCGECPDDGNEIFLQCPELLSIHVPSNAKSWAGMKEWQGIPITTANAVSKSNKRMELVDDCMWTYRVNNGEATIVATKRRSKDCAVSYLPKGHVVIPSILGGVGVTCIGSSAFKESDGLTSVVIPPTVKCIGAEAFHCCYYLKSVEIPEGVTNIQGHAFRYCNRLTSVKIPSSVTHIGPGAFNGCSSLTSFVVSQKNANFASINGLLCTKDGKTVIAGVNGDVVIPSGVMNIESAAFYHYGVKSVKIPGSVTNIGDLAFYFCHSLKSIHVPANAKNWAGMKKFQGIPLVFDAESR